MECNKEEVKIGVYHWENKVCENNPSVLALKILQSNVCNRRKYYAPKEPECQGVWSKRSTMDNATTTATKPGRKVILGSLEDGQRCK